MAINLSSRPEVLCKKGVLNNLSKRTGKRLRQSLFLNNALVTQVLSYEFFDIYNTNFFNKKSLLAASVTLATKKQWIIWKEDRFIVPTLFQIICKLKLLLLFYFYGGMELILKSNKLMQIRECRKSFHTETVEIAIIAMQKQISAIKLVSVTSIWSVI